MYDPMVNVYLSADKNVVYLGKPNNLCEVRNVSNTTGVTLSLRLSKIIYVPLCTRVQAVEGHTVEVAVAYG